MYIFSDMNEPRLIEAALHTDQGQVRDHNEDFILCLEPTTNEEEQQHGWVYIVADGVGGADAGEVASQFASERTLNHYLTNHQEKHWGKRLQQAMKQANTELREFVADREGPSRMATTMVATAIQENLAYISNVGDSRAYLWHKGIFEQVTKDHSLVAKLVEEGAITAKEAENHPRKNVILYSLGSERDPQIDLFDISLTEGDVLLLCSDGLTRHVADHELAAIISKKSPEIATDTLINLANQRGGEDNISAAVIRYNHAKPSQVKDKATKKATTKRKKARRKLLWVLTLLLSLVQVFLIISAWLILIPR